MSERGSNLGGGDVKAQEGDWEMLSDEEGCAGDGVELGE